MGKRGPKKGNGGAPKKDLNAKLDQTILETIEKMSIMQCTQVEISEFIGISVPTLLKNKNFVKTYKKGIEGGKASLRRLQWKGAMDGNSTMLIWLGKQYLDQSDKKELSGSGGGPITFKVVYDS